MKKVISKNSSIGFWVVFIIGVIAALYVGGWLMFIQPIIEACKAFDAGSLTGVMVGTTVLKCIFASPVGSIIAYIGTLLAGVVAALTDK